MIELGEELKACTTTPWLSSTFLTAEPNHQSVTDFKDFNPRLLMQFNLRALDIFTRP